MPNLVALRIKGEKVSRVGFEQHLKRFAAQRRGAFPIKETLLVAADVKAHPTFYGH